MQGDDAPKRGRRPKGKEQRSAFGEMLESHYFTRSGKSWSDLAEKTGLDKSIISQLITGKFTGETHRRNIVWIIQALKSWNLLHTLDQANTLLRTANMNPLNPANSEERTLIERIQPVLPIAPGRFIGRENDSTEAVRRLLNGRLLTLTGEGGVGKTRLALHIAQTQAGTYPDGVYYVALDALNDADQVADAIARELGVFGERGTTAIDRIQNYIRHKNLLLVLDNFEHVMGAAPLIAAILQAIPPSRSASEPCTRILVTSRHVLQVRGETRYIVPPLALPELAHLPPVSDLQHIPAIQLYIDRATEVNPDFALSSDNAVAIAKICVKQDGLPLAIELVAARSTAYNPLELWEMLQNHLLTLNAEIRDLPPRQQTIRDTIAWSYTLLNAADKRTFVKLAIFMGSFTKDAVTHICASDESGADAILARLESLLNKSFVRKAESMRNDRYRMLQPIREYARVLLNETGQASSLQKLHAAYYTALAERLGTQLNTSAQQQALTELEENFSNIREAFEWAARTASFDRLAHVVPLLVLFCWGHGHVDDGRRWLACVLDHRQDLVEAVLARVLSAQGVFAAIHGDFTQASSLLKEGLALHEAHNDTEAAQRVRGNLARVYVAQEDLDQATALLTPEIKIVPAETNGQKIADSLYVFGLIALAQKDYAAAENYLTRSLTLLDQLQRHNDVAGVQTYLAWIAVDQQNFMKARSLLMESLATVRKTENKPLSAHCLESMAALTFKIGQVAAAAQLLGSSEAIREAIGEIILPFERRHFDSIAEEVQSKLTPPEYADLWAIGHARTWAQAIAYAQQMIKEKIISNSIKENRRRSKISTPRGQSRALTFKKAAHPPRYRSAH